MTSHSRENENSVKNLKRKKGRTSGFEQWGGYMAAKKVKLKAQFENKKDIEVEDDKECTQIFKGISIFVNGYTKPTAEELKRLMLIHGGTYHYYHSSRTTHTVASNLPKSKLKNLKSEIVVTTSWITDSIKAGKLLPHQNYLLYTPEALNKQYRLTTNFLNTEVTLRNNNKDLSDENKCDTEQSGVNDGICEQHTIFEERTSEEDSMHSEKCATLAQTCLSKVSGTIESHEIIVQDDINSKNDAVLTPDCSLTVDSFQNVVKSSLLSNNNESSTNCQNSDSAVAFNKSGLAIRAGQPGFLSEFYSHSRLHFISTLGQEMKRYVHSKITDHTGYFPAREKLKKIARTVLPDIFSDEINCSNNEEDQNVIMHLDMDCFFVSVGLRKHLELKGQPVAVTHSKGMRGGPQEGSNIHYEAAHYTNQSKEKIQRLMTANDKLQGEINTETPKLSMYSKEFGSLSEIASCSYEARKAGVKNGMFLGAALRLCPNLKTIPYDFEGFLEVSKQLHDIVSSYTLDIESISCDELYIDCTELLQDTQISPDKFASILRSEIEEKTNCTASAGIGNNMLLARLANKHAKPNGQYYIKNAEVDEFMMPQKVRDLPGVGRSISEKLKHFGIETCGDLKSWTLLKLKQEFGSKTGQTLFNYCRGKDDRKVQVQKERKSVSTEINYGIRFEVESEIYNFISELATEVHKRLQNINCKGKSLTLKLMIRRPDAPIQTAKFMGHGVCDHISKSVVLKCATDDSSVIGNECCKIARSLKVKPEDYRGIGIQVSKLETAGKDCKSHKSIASFLCRSPEKGGNNMQKSLLPQDEHKVAENPSSTKTIANPLPERSTIKDFLSKKTLPHNESDKEIGITFDKIDPDVLNALPEHIRKEILDTYSSHSVKVQASSSSPTHSNTSRNAIHSNLDKPTCSRNLILSRNKEKVDSNVTRQIMLSKIDPEVLNELPDNIRKEVLEAYGISSQVSTFSGSASPVNIQENSNSVKSPYKRNLVLSPNRKKVNIDKSNQMTSEAVSDSKMQTNNLDDVKVMTTLHGVDDINEIRSIIKEWINNTEVALEEDVQQLKDYLLDSVNEDLKKVDVILKYFCRLVSSSNCMWKQIYRNVLEIVQQKTKEIYGAQLKIESDFSN